MRLEQIWRYPVKSMGGETLSSADLDPGGIAGDRRVAVVDPAARRPEHPVTARELPQLLRFSARWEAGEAVISGPGLAPTSHRDPAAAAAVADVVGRRVELVDRAEGEFDDSPLHAVHLLWVRELEAELGAPVDPRRFRATLYLDGVGGEPEADWVGRLLDVGPAVLEVVDLCRRCALTTRDPSAPGRAWPQLLRHLVGQRAEVLGVYLRTAVPGEVAVGAEVELGRGPGGGAHSWPGATRRLR